MRSALAIVFSGELSVFDCLALVDRVGVGVAGEFTAVGEVYLAVLDVPVAHFIAGDSVVVLVELTVTDEEPVGAVSANAGVVLSFLVVVVGDFLVPFGAQFDVAELVRRFNARILV